MTYKNGNYLVSTEKNGTKCYMKLNLSDNNFNASFPDSLDIKITNRCSRGCPFCHENSTPDGKDADLEQLLKVIKTLPSKPIELALGGGNILEMDEEKVNNFIVALKERNYKIAITVNIFDLLDLKGNLPKYIPILDAMGISISNLFLQKILTDKTFYNEFNDNFLRNYSLPSNIVFHNILGITDMELLKEFNNKVLMFHRQFRKFLFLGYKDFGRGKNWKDKPTIEKINSDVNFIFENFTKNCVTSFDNLAIEQGNIKSRLTSTEWERYYMGNEFSHSMYIDGVSQIFAPTSRSIENSNWSNWDNNIINYFISEKNEH